MNRISDNGTEARAGTALALATAGLRYDDRPGKLSLAGGFGNFKGHLGWHLASATTQAWFSACTRRQSGREAALCGGDRCRCSTGTGDDRGPTPRRACPAEREEGGQKMAHPASIDRNGVLVLNRSALL